MVEQADGIVLRVIGTKAVGADHFGEVVGLVRGRRIPAATHFAQPHAKARLGELPGGLGSGEPAADDVDVEGHSGALADWPHLVMPGLTRHPPFLQGPSREAGPGPSPGDGWWHAHLHDWL